MKYALFKIYFIADCETVSVRLTASCFRSFPVLPAPLLYGNVFDASCVLKETKSCTDNEGACLFYDRDALRLAFHGLTIGLHTVATVLYYVTYFLARRKLSLFTAQHNAQLIGENARGASRLLTSAEKPSEITEITYL